MLALETGMCVVCECVWGGACVRTPQLIPSYVASSSRPGAVPPPHSPAGRPAPPGSGGRVLRKLHPLTARARNACLFSKYPRKDWPLRGQENRPLGSINTSPFREPSRRGKGRVTGQLGVTGLHLGQQSKTPAPSPC